MRFGSDWKKLHHDMVILENVKASYSHKNAVPALFNYSCSPEQLSPQTGGTFLTCKPSGSLINLLFLFLITFTPSSSSFSSLVLPSPLSCSDVQQSFRPPSSSPLPLSTPHSLPCHSLPPPLPQICPPHLPGFC